MRVLGELFRMQRYQPSNNGSHQGQKEIKAFLPAFIVTPERLAKVLEVLDQKIGQWMSSRRALLGGGCTIGDHFAPHNPVEKPANPTMIATCITPCPPTTRT